MTDNQLAALIVNTLTQGFTAQTIVCGVKQSQQPTQQGAPSAPYVFFQKMFDKRYGSPARLDVYDTVAGAMTHTETASVLTTYQFGALAIQNPADITSMTANDYLSVAAAILQMLPTVVSFKANGVGIQRITQIRQTYFKDETTFNEASPSFDIVFSHERAINVPQTSTAEFVGNTNGF